LIAVRQVGEFETESGAQCREQRLVGREVLLHDGIPEGLMLVIRLPKLLYLVDSNQLLDRWLQPLIGKLLDGSPPPGSGLSDMNALAG
jgi:hypothetical protein